MFLVNVNVVSLVEKRHPQNYYYPYNYFYLFLQDYQHLIPAYFARRTMHVSSST